MIRFDHFETLAEQLVEGSLGRLFRMPLSPEDLASRLARAMEDEQDSDDRGNPLFPNRFELLLNPADCGVLGRHLQVVSAELERFLENLAADGGGRFSGRLELSIHPLTDVGVGRVMVRASHQPDVDGPDDTHEVQPLVSSKADPGLWLLRLDDREFRLGEPVIRIGRALSNDIVLEDSRISRRHAQLRWREGRYHLGDAGSTHGIVLNDHRLQDGEEIPLSAGDSVSLAGLILTVERDHSHSTQELRRTSSSASLAEGANSETTA